MKKQTHKYEWYLSEENRFIYDEEAKEYITPKYNEAKNTLNKIKELIKEIEFSDNIISNYLEIGEKLSLINTLIEYDNNDF